MEKLEQNAVLSLLDDIHGLFVEEALVFSEAKKQVEALKLHLLAETSTWNHTLTPQSWQIHMIKTKETKITRQSGSRVKLAPRSCTRNLYKGWNEVCMFMEQRIKFAIKPGELKIEIL